MDKKLNKFNLKKSKYFIKNSFKLQIFTKKTPNKQK